MNAAEISPRTAGRLWQALDASGLKVGPTTRSADVVRALEPGWEPATIARFIETEVGPLPGDA